LKLTGDKKIPLTLFFGSLLGWTWILFNRIILPQHQASQLHACFIKQLTGLPCPSCGTTRSVICLLSGNFKEAFFFNPLGILMVFLMFIIPLWILYDWICRKKSFYRIYLKIEVLFRNKFIAGTAILLIISNWIWNFMKEY